MVGLRESLVNSVKNAWCTVTTPAPAVLNLLGNIYNGLGAEDQGDDLIALGNQVRAARGIVCSEPAPALPLPDAPGGKCPGVLYDVTFELWRPGESSPRSTVSEDGLVGPVSLTRESVGGQGILDTVRLVAQNFNRDYRIAQNIENEFRAESFVRQDGQPDDCGVPPPLQPDYDPDDYTTSPPVTYDPPSGPPVTINPSIVFSPVYVDGEFNIVVPVDITFEDGSSLFGDFNLSTGDISFGSGGGTGPTTPNDDSPVPDDGGPDGDEPTPEEEQGEVIIAVFVRVTEIAGNAKITQIFGGPQDPDLFIPRLAYVSFHCAIGRGRGLAWTPDIDVRHRSGLVECPVSWGARRVSVVPQLGVTLQTTIIRGVSRRQLALRAANS